MVNSLNKADCINHSQFLDSIQTISKMFFYNFKPYKFISAIFTSHDVKQLKSLSTDTSVIRSKAERTPSPYDMNRQGFPLHSTPFNHRSVSRA